METPNTPIKEVRDTTLSYLTLRTMMGILGMALPWILYIINDFTFQTSISHFYYSKGETTFIAILASFGFFLISYPGRKKADGEWLSDNAICTIAGIMALGTAFIPTAAEQEGLFPVDITQQCIEHITYLSETEGMKLLWMHSQDLPGIIHLCCAGLFLILMGYMSFFRFVKGNQSTFRKIFYKVCGGIVFASIAYLIVGKFIIGKFATIYDILIAEIVALTFFGLAWLVKGNQIGGIIRWMFTFGKKKDTVANK